MKVILKKFVKNVGRAGDVVEVSDGYGKNFLFKQNLAVPANSENMNVNNQQKQAEARAKAEAKADAIRIKGIIDGTTIKIKATIGKNGNLFGSITNKEISEELAKQNIVVDKKKIVLDKTIKTLGRYNIVCKLYPEVSANLTVEVVE